MDRNSEILVLETWFKGWICDLLRQDIVCCFFLCVEPHWHPTFILWIESKQDIWFQPLFPGGFVAPLRALNPKQDPCAPSGGGRVENEKVSVVTTHCRGDNNYQEWHVCHGQLKAVYCFSSQHLWWTLIPDSLGVNFAKADLDVHKICFGELCAHSFA